MSNKRSKITYSLKTAGIVIAVVFLFGLVYHFRPRPSQNYQDTSNQAVSVSEDTPDTGSATPGVAEPVPTSIPVKLPSKKLLNVPFASQAPFGDWSQPYENACEEASIIMVEHYLNNQSLSKDQMKQEIDDAVTWQLTSWGNHSDQNAVGTLKLATDYFKLSGQIIQSTTADIIKQQIAAGHPVITPTAGRLLGNPNFTGAGPEYHMLVVKGYDDAQGVFITNDPGTRKGESYIYKYDVLIQAISGPKVDNVKSVLVMSK